MKPSTPNETIRVGQIEVRYLLEGPDTNGALVLFEVLVPAEARVPAPHRHVTYDETIYGLEGTCTFVVEGNELALEPGQSIFIPRGAAHHFQNPGPGPARFLATVTPGVLSPDYFREIEAVIRAGGPPDMRLIAEIMQRHGLEMV